MTIRKLNEKEPIDGLLTLDGSDLNDASTTAKGVVQIGNALNIENGIVSVDTRAVNITELGIDTPLADYPIGNFSKRISKSLNESEYVTVSNVIKEIFKPDLLQLSAGNYFRIYLTTVRFDTNNGYQEVKVFTNTSNNFRHIFTLNRTNVSGSFTEWRGNVETIVGTGTPEGNVSAPISVRYMDVNTGNIYFKTGNANTFNNTGWVVKN